MVFSVAPIGLVGAEVRQCCAAVDLESSLLADTPRSLRPGCRREFFKFTIAIYGCIYVIDIFQPLTLSELL